ncbi:MAG: hypothetical protein ACK54K_14330 [Gemmatimonadaceae bacterium]
MTLLESLIATVLLAVVAIACLEGTRGATRVQQRTAARVTALARAESELARQVAGATVSAADVATAPRVRRTPYVTPTGARRLDLVEVEVAGPDGGTMRLSRLVERGR